MQHSPTLFALAAAAALALSPADAQTPLAKTLVVGGLSQPLYVDAPPGDEDRLFIVEENTGLIKIFKDGALLATPFLDIFTRINGSGERGLLGLAFDPKYDTNRHFYVYYTRTPDGALVVERFTASAANPDFADPATGVIKLGPIPHPINTNHNGGCISFSPTDAHLGYLYIATGDGGGSGDTPCNAQNGQSLLGKLLRIDVDDGDPLIPPTNPFVGNAEVRNEIWAYGLRNPWRFSFDRVTGDLFIGDVGQNTKEEIDFQSAASLGGENYGWKIMEGFNCFGTANCVNPPLCNDPSLVRPILDHVRTEARSITGGYVYRGCAIPDLVGTYFYADYATGRIWSLRYDGTTISEYQERTAQLGGAITNLCSFGQDQKGELYMCKRNTGQVFRIVADAAPSSVDLGFGKVGSNGVEPKLETCGLIANATDTAEVILRRAPANAAAALLISGSASPVNLPWGTIVGSAPLFAFPFTTDNDGRVQFTIPGGLGPAVLVFQYAMVDIGVSNNIGLSNGIQINYP